MSNNQQVTITLTAENWKAIMEFIKFSCQLKGDDWVKWGQGINQYIQSSIEKTVIENSVSGITRTAVSSSNLSSVGYDVKTKTLEIQFNDGSIYQYYQVPQDVYVGLMKAESHGKYFYAVIQNSFQYKKVGHETIQKKYRHDKDDDVDFDYGDDEYDPHDEAFGQWIDLGGGERTWDSYIDDD